MNIFLRNESYEKEQHISPIYFVFLLFFEIIGCASGGVS